jgi:hypothetical protein
MSLRAGRGGRQALPHPLGLIGREGEPPSRRPVEVGHRPFAPHEPGLRVPLAEQQMADLVGGEVAEHLDLRGLGVPLEAADAVDEDRGKGPDSAVGWHQGEAVAAGAASGGGRVQNPEDVAPGRGVRLHGESAAHSLPGAEQSTQRSSIPERAKMWTTAVSTAAFSRALPNGW